MKCALYLFLAIFLSSNLSGASYVSSSISSTGVTRKTLKSSRLPTSLDLSCWEITINVKADEKAVVTFWSKGSTSAYPVSATGYTAVGSIYDDIGGGQIIPPGTGYLTMTFTSSTTMRITPVVTVNSTPGGWYSAEITVDAVYKSTVFDISFDGNQGSGYMSPQTFHEGRSQSLKQNAFTRSGYAFRGWSEQSTAPQPTYDDGEYAQFAEAKTLYAVWERIYGTPAGSDYRRLTFDAAGGTVLPGSRLFYVGSAFLSDSPVPTRVGYEFTEWRLPTGAAVGPATKCTGAMTITAQWMPRKYSVALSQNGGTGGQESAVATYDAKLPKVRIPSRTGYSFEGYWTDPTGGAQYVLADGSGCMNWTFAEDGRTLHAHWKAKSYQVKLADEGGSGGMGTLSATYDSAFPNVSVPTRSGYVFTGYYTADGVKYVDSHGRGVRSYDYPDGMTLHARWTDAVEVLFHPNWTAEDVDFGDLSLVTGVYGVDMIYETLQVPTRTGYAFSGWFTKPKGGEAITADSIVREQVRDLYARWTPNAGTVLIETAGENGSKSFELYHASTSDVYIDLADYPWITPNALVVGSNVMVLSGRQIKVVWSGTAIIGLSFSSNETDAYRCATLAVRRGTSASGEIEGYVVVLQAPRYPLIAFEANGGKGEMPKFVCRPDCVRQLPACAFAAPFGKQFAGWGCVETGRLYDDRMLVFNIAAMGETRTFRALWTALPGGVTISTPENVRASDGNSTSGVDVSWTPVSGATAYAVFRHTTNDRESAQEIETTTSTQCSDASAAPGVRYYYWIVAGNGESISSFGGPDSGYVGLKPPSSVSATDGTTTDGTIVTFSSVKGATAYCIYRGSGANSATAEFLGYADFTARSYTDRTCEKGVTYYYWVRAYAESSGSYSAFSEPDSGWRSAATRPGIPTGLQVSVGYGTAISLSWNAVSGATSYQVYRSSSLAGQYELVARSTSTSATDWKLGMRSGYYYYGVTAVNAAGESGMSFTVCVFVPGT